MQIDAVHVERHSRFCLLGKAPGKDTATVVAAAKNVGISNSRGCIAVYTDTSITSAKQRDCKQDDRDRDENDEN